MTKKKYSPCFQCNNRIPGCHSYCEEGKKWSEEKAKEKQQKMDAEHMTYCGAYDFYNRETPSERMRRLKSKSRGWR